MSQHSRTAWADALLSEPGMRAACDEELAAVLSAIVSILPHPPPALQLAAIASALDRSLPRVRELTRAPVPFAHLAAGPLRRLVYAFGFALAQHDPALAGAVAHLGHMLELPIGEGRELARLVLGVRSEAQLRATISSS